MQPNTPRLLTVLHRGVGCDRGWRECPRPTSLPGYSEFRLQKQRKREHAVRGFHKKAENAMVIHTYVVQR